MATNNSNDLRVQNAKCLVNETRQGNTYLFISKPSVWEGGDENPPTPNNTINEFYRTYDQMLSAKRILTTEVHHLIRKVKWSSGVTYDMYNNLTTQNRRTKSGASNLYDALFVVINSSNEVYACLSNNGGRGSTVEPRSSSDTPFYTSDDYQWMRLFTLTPDLVVNYTTENFIPITTTNSVNRPVGEINTAIIVNPGNDYTESPAGATNQLPYYYTKVIGDGDGAVARIQVTTGSITEIRIVRGGSDYTFGEIDFSDGNTYASIGDLDLGINPLNPLGDGTFEAQVILPPVGGWGTDLVRELGGTRVGIFTNLLFDEVDFFTDVTFRRIGLVQNPSFAGGADVTATGCYALKVNAVSGVDTYQIGETITQTVIENNEEHQARGTVISFKDGVIRYYQDPSVHRDADGHLHAFKGTGQVYGLNTEKLTQPDTPFSGALQNTTFVSGYADPELNKYSGTFTYLANISPVLRQSTQSEKVSLVITY